MAKLRIEKVAALPSILTPDTLYFVKVGSTITSYLTDHTGTTAYPTSAASSNDVHPFLLMGVG
jgi:hypothetical protein